MRQIVPITSGATAGRSCLRVSGVILLKTFRTGWHDEQLRDGTVIWTSPSMTRTSPHRLRRC
jgi:hypothetical protein